MTAGIAFGGIKLDPVEIGINGNAILGIKESGKSYLGTELGEILFDAGIPFITFDPIGIWHNMRTPGRGKGYPIVVAGGMHGDIKLTPETAPAIVEAALKGGISLVLDLFDPELSKSDWRRIVKDCARLLLAKNTQYGLRHIFIEEAAEFVPQRVLDGQVFDAVERVIRMGGNSRLGCTLISPRSQEINKSVLELAENLFLFRQRGKNALENIKKWLDVAGAAGGDVMRTLPSLPTGECWAWLGGSDLPVHVKVPPKNSFHPDRRVLGGSTVPAKKKPVDVSKFLTALGKTLPQLEEEAKANDPAALRAEIATLKRKITGLERASAPAWPDQREAVATLHAEARANRATIAALEKTIRAARGDVSRLAKTLDAELPAPARTVELDLNQMARAPIDAAIAAGETAGPRRHVPSPGADTGVVPPGCAKPLAVLAGVYPGGLTEGQWATAAGYKKSGGTWGSYRRGLLRNGLIEQRGNMWHATELGANSAGEVELPPPPGPDLARWWAKRIPGTPKMVEILIEAFPDPMTKEELASRMDMIASGGTFGSYVRGLIRNGIAQQNPTGIWLSADVMGEG